MNRQVKLSKTAEIKLEKLFQYLLDDWSIKVKSDFIIKLDRSIELIKSNPEVFTESQKYKGLYKCIVTKQTSLYYRFDSKMIYIVTICDNRQNPNRLKQELK